MAVAQQDALAPVLGRQQEDDAGSESSSGDASSSTSMSEAENLGSSELAKRGVAFHLGGRQEPCTVQRRYLSPLEVRFSQLKMRHLFGDGRRVADAVPLVRAERCAEEDTAEHGGTWRLEAPFPVIEVIRWRCKLRDETGRAKVDPATGVDMLDGQERWFALDNRRLYCFQEVAARLWPERCVVEMSEVVSGTHLRIRGLRKFRTLDVGKSIVCGSTADGVSFMRWCWRAQVGIDEAGGDSDAADTATARAKAPSTRKSHGRSTVLAHLASLKEGDYDRIERSKKLTWVLRRGADTFSIPMDEDGWVRVNDLLHLEFLGCATAEEFFSMVEDSNKQKQRYELKESDTGAFEVFIRASRPSKQARLREQQVAEREHSAAGLKPAAATATPVGSVSVGASSATVGKGGKHGKGVSGRGSMIDWSKRLSWLLRRGAETFNIQVDEDGWVRVNDLLPLESLGCETAEHFFCLVEESNKHKPRYELKESESGVFEILIRATRSSKDQQAAGRDLPAATVVAPAGSMPRDAPVAGVHGGVGSGSASSYTEERRQSTLAKGGKAGRGASGKGGKVREEELKPPDADLALAAASAAVGAAAAGGRNRADKGTASRGERATASQDAVPAASPKRVAGPSAAAAATAKPQRAPYAKAKKGAGFPGLGAFPPNSVQAMHQLQYMHHMHSVYSHYQLQLRHQLMHFGQLQQLQQLQLLAGYHQMHGASATQLDEMHTEAELGYEGASPMPFDEMHGEAELGYEDPAAAPMPPTYEREVCGIEAKIAQAREVASNRSGPTLPESDHLEAKIAEAREVARERTEFTAAHGAAPPSARPQDLIVKIAEARESAKQRNTSSGTGLDVEARIAEVLAAARQRRSGAEN